MKTEFKFSNLLGTVYTKGSLLFTPDGTCLLSPVGNRVTVFDLINNKSYTLPSAHRRNISCLALNPQGNLLLSIDEDGRAILTNFPRRVVLHHFSFREPITALAFSTSGRHFAVGLGRLVEIWHTPSTPDTNVDGELEFAPFVRYRTFAGHHDNVRSLEWSSDSRFLLSSSKDLTARIWSLDPEEGFVPTALAGHREGVLGAWFSSDQESIYTVSKDGALFRWNYSPRPDMIENGNDGEDETLRWRICERHYFMQNNARATCVTYHAASNILVVGFSSGLFGLYELPDFNMIHTLSISQNNIDFVTINKSGEWLAFGASKLGQLLVWEWQSESYILKQQGHFDAMNALAYSPDGQRIVTTADDGKIKVWEVQSGFCIVTFTEHSSGVTACEFAKRGNVLFTASLDGSVRAWDLIRYRNFRTFTAPTRLSFSSLAVDPSGEVICAGSLDSFEIHIWSVQTGQLLDQLSGHEGPISTLSFTPSGDTLVSGSWDHTLRLWSLFSRTQTSESFPLQSTILSLAIRPDSKQLAVSTLDGNLTFFSIPTSTLTTTISSRPDISGGRHTNSARTAATSTSSKHISTLAYSTDGTCVLAGGTSKYILLYSVATATLLKKYTISNNLSLSGTQEYLSTRNLTAAGPTSLLDTRGEASDLSDRLDTTLPGVARGDASTRHTQPSIRVSSVAFSPTGRAFCAASTEGLLIYSLDTTPVFDPIDLSLTITPASTLATLSQKSYLLALIMAFRLNLPSLLLRVYEGIPPPSITLAVSQIPTVYLARLMMLVARCMEERPHLEFNLLWCEALLSCHGRWLGENRGLLGAELRSVQRAVGGVGREVGRLAEGNGYVLGYLLSQCEGEVGALEVGVGG